ncbi:hypothetical protein MKX29_24130 [Cytobacillus sp. FSL R7-0696]|uniref:hypothetical protein n=1 Tax=Cytobacillus sp. FSL R7-0696 TaxID=2921691 RepID=UPI0030F99FE4
MNNAQFNERVNELWAQTKAGNLPRPSRFEAIEALTEQYYVANGKMPDAGALDRLATLCLYEEVTDPHPDKMTRDEYPIMSDEQYARRTEGKHVKKGDFPKGEIALGAISNYGTDNRDHRPPIRAKRTVAEYLQVDYANKSRNKERQRKYREFTKVQPVVRSVVND